MYEAAIDLPNIKTLSVAQGLVDSPNFSSSKNSRTFSQIININE